MRAEDYDSPGQYLKEVRESLRLNIHDISKALHIREQYIEALEQSDFEALPDAVYSKGYIKNYSEFLGVDAHEVLEHFRAAGALGDEYRLEELPVPTEQENRPGYAVTISLILLLIGYLVYYFAFREVDQPKEINLIPDRLTPMLEESESETSQTKDCFSDELALYPPCYYREVHGFTFLPTAPVETVLTIDAD
jgi:cytoskeletal protein RodZ